MMRYPQAIPGKMGEKCPYCGERKYMNAKYCQRCDPAFRSYSRAVEWAEKNENVVGPCTLVFRQYGYAYTEWPPLGEKGAHYLSDDGPTFAFPKPKRNKKQYAASSGAEKGAAA